MVVAEAVAETDVDLKTPQENLFSHKMVVHPLYHFCRFSVTLGSLPALLSPDQTRKNMLERKRRVQWRT